MSSSSWSDRLMAAFWSLFPIVRWCDFILVSTEKNQSEFGPKIKIFIKKRVEMTVKSKKTPWRSEILSNQADSLLYSLVGVWSSVIVLSPHVNLTWCFWWDPLLYILCWHAKRKILNFYTIKKLVIVSYYFYWK
jgi:hypothetical protein